MKADAPILAQIANCKRRLSEDALRDAKIAAKQNNITVPSLIWLLTDVYESGHVRSNAFLDCPACVIDDGLVIDRLGAGLAYTPWQWTEKGRSILKKAQR